MTVKELRTANNIGLSFCEGEYYLKGTYSGKIYYKSWTKRKPPEDL